LAILAGQVLAQALREPWTPRRVLLKQRLAALPARPAPLESPVVIRWDEHHIPFIQAETNGDLAVAIGVVHLHLRWAQLEILRRIAQGRLAEMIGPLGVEIDHGLRILGLHRAAEAIAEGLSDSTTRWLNGFVAGLNHYIEHATEVPREFALLGIRREPWCVGDVLSLGRLVSADVNWISWLSLLRRPEIAPETNWDRLVICSVEEALGRGDAVGAEGPGSNSVSTASWRSVDGGAFLASDPHLSVALPNSWLLAGIRSPGFHAVGLMIPGLPFIALGRNPWIAWGGTNLHAASSDLFDLSALPAGEIAVRRERLRVRWFADREVVVRESRHGPIISDLPSLRDSPPVALRWIGQDPSDEIGAMLGVNRARNWSEFRAALEGFAIPGQNMVYADVEGNIGKAMAAKLPRRPADSGGALIRPLEQVAAWESFAAGSELPAEANPACGYIASANDRPPPSPTVIGFLFSPPDRRDRLARLLDRRDLSLTDFIALQSDVHSSSALAFCAELVHCLTESQGSSKPLRTFGHLLRELSSWDGDYATESKGALAFELLVFHLARRLVGGKLARLYSAGWNLIALVRSDFQRMPRSQATAALRAAARAATRDLGARRNWGAIHRMRPRYLLGAVPALGGLLKVPEWPVPGSRETIFKTAYRLTNRRHYVRLAANARHISDLSDPNRNYFVLLGGQDGWIGSTTAVDQIPLWRTGRYIELPMSPEAIERSFAHRTELRP
jgi:penicillin amidase